MRETPKREYRLRLAKAWIKTYSGNNIVKVYSKKYAVDKLCAVMELRMSGVEIPEAYENQLRQSMEARKQHRCSMKKKRQDTLNARCEFESDENFAMIIGYTSGGYPYGVSHEEMEEIIQKQESE
jgi:ribosomal protein L34E